MRGYTTLGSVPIEDVFKLTQKYFTYNNVRVRVDYKRINVFKQSIKCSKCGIKGNIFLVQRTGSGPWHLNLWHVSAYGQILLTVDHIHPKSKGGTSVPKNLQTMCSKCNNKKGNTYEENPPLEKVHSTQVSTTESGRAITKGFSQLPAAEDTQVLVKEQTMSIEDTVLLAYQIADEAHKGQTRRDGVTPYITHPKKVAERFKDAPEIAIVALLHDVLEDSSLTAQDLINKGIPKELVESVVAMTKVKEEPYLDYILRVKQNSIASIVKIADIRHNMKTATGAQRDKYELALHILLKL